MTTDTEALLWRRFNEWFCARRPDYPSEWAAYQAGHAAAKAETADPVVGRWYFVANDGAATLCVDEADARESAAEADLMYPRMAPHRAVQLVPADQLAAAVAAGPENMDLGGAIAEKMAYNAKRADHTPEARAAAATLRQAIEHEQSKPLTNDVVRDAERYRWLAGFCSSTSEHWGGRWSIVIEGPAPKSHDSEDDLDDAIDAAMLACIRRRGGDA